MSNSSQVKVTIGLTTIDHVCGTRHLAEANGIKVREEKTFKGLEAIEIFQSQPFLNNMPDALNAAILLLATEQKHLTTVSCQNFNDKHIAHELTRDIALTIHHCD